MNQHMHREARTAKMPSRTGVICILFVVVLLTSIYFRYRDLPFRSAQWKAAQAPPDTGLGSMFPMPPGMRMRMHADLLNRIPLKGMNRKEITEMLGAPDYNSDVSLYQYKLKAGGLGFLVLEIWFDDRGMVDSTRIVDTD